MIDVKFEIPDQEALALAQLMKRIGWNEIRGNAIDDDEAYLMRDAIYRLQQGLSEAGYSPR
jgi:hypothetical protein